MTNKPKVFLSYHREDADVADRLRSAMQNAGMSAFVEQFSLSPQDSIGKALSSGISASDFIVVLLSPAALHSSWMVEELKSLTSSEWRQRAISLILVKIRPCQIPEFLSGWVTIDATRSFPKGIEKLVELLCTATKINLYQLGPHQFEDLVIDLLKAYGFRNVKRAPFIHESGIDIFTEYRTKDPFGRPQVQDWVVEVKSHTQKTDISSLREFLGAISLRKERIHALFVTSSQLTSAAREWIEGLDKKGAPPLTVLEGTNVIGLLLEKPKVIQKYFGSAEEGSHA
jgi:hypothetical protein